MNFFGPLPSTWFSLAVTLARHHLALSPLPIRVRSSQKGAPQLFATSEHASVTRNQPGESHSNGSRNVKTARSHSGDSDREWNHAAQLPAGWPVWTNQSQVSMPHPISLKRAAVSASCRSLACTLE